MSHPETRPPDRPVPDEPEPGATGPRPAGDPGAAGRGPGAREMGAVVLLCAAGGGLAVFAAGRAWLRVAAERRPPFPDVDLALTGRDLAPVVLGLGVVGLAGVVGLLATRRLGRLAVAAVLVLSGLGVLAGALSHLGTPGDAEIRDLVADSGRAGAVADAAAVTATAVPGWPLLAALGGLLLAAGGVLAVARSRRWPTMSSRYERPATRAGTPRPRTDAARWDALDRGDDWTATDPAPPEPRPGA